MTAKSKYSYELVTDIHDMDFNGVAKTSSVLRYIQTAAQNQLTENGLSYDNLISRGLAFIISRMKLEIYKPIFVYDRLMATSFPCHSKGFIFPRCYTLRRDGEIIARASSSWALINTETHSLVRTSGFTLPIETSDPLDMDMMHERFPDGLKTVGTYTVSYQDLDQNRHLNNTKYADMFSNFLPLDMRRIASIDISYKSEARWKEALTVLRADAGEKTYIRTVKPDGSINAEAIVTLADIT
ncbi:MAG: hypothetical protein IJY01_03695 [Clostridia bacterium]|nr:hypothetical protein [Clostridia bacterium]MBQ8289954.1 hypothetical protein [Clostridia bacterium]